MILGRSIELAAIDAVVSAASAGSGGVLVLVGDAGIGKTTLLDEVAASAADAGALVLVTRGAESESGMSFAGLHGLLHPLSERLSELPPPQGAALAAAITLGPPVEATGKFAVAAAALSLLTTAADERPVVCLVDDYHWLDASSADALAFIARRLHVDSIALVVATRPRTEPPLPIAGLPTLTLDGLSATAGRELVDGRYAGVAPKVAAELVQRTAGNPLALLAMAAELNDAQRDGTAELDHLTGSVGASIEAAVTTRLEPCTPSARALLLLLAAGETVPTGVVADVVTAAGFSFVDALDEAESAGLVRTHGETLSVNHPLVRSVVYNAASPTERRLAHRQLAAALESAGHGGASVWHRAAAAAGFDDVLAGDLAALGGMDAARGDPSAGVAAMRRAAELTRDREHRAELLAAAAGLAVQAGAVPDALVAGVAELTLNPVLRAQAQVALAAALAMHGRFDELGLLLEREAEASIAADPAIGASLFAWNSVRCWMSVDPADWSVAERAWQLVEDQPITEDGLTAFTAIARCAVFVSEGRRREALALLDRWLAAIEGRPDSIEMFPTAGWILLFLGEPGRARTVVDLALAKARTAGNVTAVAWLLCVSAEIAFRTGRWAEAEADASESMELSEAAGISFATGRCRLTVAMVAAARGDVETVERHAAFGEQFSAFTRTTAYGDLAAAARGHLALAQGDWATARRRLQEPCERLTVLGLRAATIYHLHPDLIEACVCDDDPEEARRVIAGLEKLADMSDPAWAHSITARYEGMLAPEAEMDSLFERSLELDAGRSPFEEARTRLVWGERLRRASRRRDARSQLERSLAVFERLGATPWAERTAKALRGAGARVFQPVAAPLQALTPQELRIALLVADGLTNREIAAGIFVSTKTVEAHLGRVFKTLGVRNRVELSRKL